MSQFDRSPPNPFIQNYIARHASSFWTYAANLGLPSTAAVASASAVAEEMREVFDPAGNQFRKDAFLDWFPRASNDATYVGDYLSSAGRISDGTLNLNAGLFGSGYGYSLEFLGNKLSNPMAGDIGPGNVNFGSASSLLLNYLNDPSNANDPLNLGMYAPKALGDFVGPIGPSDIAFSNFFNDLVRLDSPTTAAISMLNIAAGYQFFKDTYGSTFTNLAAVDQQTQIGLLAAFSKIGPSGFVANERWNLAFGQLPDPSKLAGGGFAVDNFAMISDLLNRDPAFAFAPDQYLAGYAAKLFGPPPNFADRFSLFNSHFPTDRLGSWTSSDGATGPVDPLTANGILPGFSFLNGMLFNTQSGQTTFGLPDGPSGSTINWSSNFANNVGAIDFGGLNQTVARSWYDPYIPTSNDYSFNPGFNYDDFQYLGNPIVLDLTGAGINITELGSSGQYVDMTGSGYQNRTAWAGAGNGVLVLDLLGNGKIEQPNQYQFTAWDPTATSDMQALRDVFDTNRNGKLDAGDASFVAFKVMVTNADGTTALRTLTELGIVSINLTTDNTSSVLADGSSIAGKTIFTRTDGSTGTVADVSLAYDANGYATQQTVTHNADGSTTSDVRAINPDGSLASETVSTTSADGLSRALKFDHSGNGIFDQTQTIVTTVNADGSRSKTIANFDVTSALSNRTVTTTSRVLSPSRPVVGRDTQGHRGTRAIARPLQAVGVHSEPWLGSFQGIAVTSLTGCLRQTSATALAG